MADSREELKRRIASGPPTGETEESGADPISALFTAYTATEFPAAILAMPLYRARAENVNLQAPKTRVIDALMEFMTMDRERRKNLQARLLVGNFYPSSYYDERKGRKPIVQPLWGEPDKDSMSAFTAALMRTLVKQWSRILSPRATAAQTPEQTLGQPAEPMTRQPQPPGVGISETGF